MIAITFAAVVQETAACGAAQLSLDTGDGVVFQGEYGPWYSQESKQFHLDEASAKNLLAGVLKSYADLGGKELTEILTMPKPPPNHVPFIGSSGNRYKARTAPFVPGTCLAPTERPWHPLKGRLAPTEGPFGEFRWVCFGRCTTSPNAWEICYQADCTLCDRKIKRQENSRPHHLSYLPVTKSSRRFQSLPW